MALAEKVVLVSGGLSGIGQATVARFAMAGATVIAADIAAETEALAADGPARFRYSLDVADAAAVGKCVEAILAVLGRIDVLVNSAGVLAGEAFLKTAPELLDRVLAVNLRGTFLLSQAVARSMAAAGGGAIINIASISGQRGNAGRAAYAASKGGVIALTQVMATELAPYAIRVNALAPGPIETPMTQGLHDPTVRQRWLALTPLGRYGKAEEVAAAAFFLASDEALFITGHVLNVDGGWQASGLTVEPGAA